MDATELKTRIVVPVCFSDEGSLERQAYEAAWLKGYAMALDYMKRGIVLVKGAYPDVPPEFQGLELPVLAWTAGCTDGAVRATRDRMETEDMLGEAAAIMDELDKTDPIPPILIGANLKSPAELQNEKRDAWLRKSDSERRQAVIDQAHAEAQAEALAGGRVVSVVVVGAFFVFLAFAVFVALCLKRW